MLKIFNLNHAFDDKIIFNNAELSVSDGEVIWLQGENGSGKTTLFRIMSGILAPVSDVDMDIQLNNEKIQLSKLKRETNYIPSKPYLFEYLSGYDNITYLISLFDLNEKYNQIMKNMEALSLATDLDMEVHTYSLGMKAKLYLGVMLERNTSIILIDELLNNIDAESLKMITQILRNKLEQERCSIIFSSHTQMMETINNTKKLCLRNERLEVI